MTEIQPYRQPQPMPITGGTPVPALPPASDVDGWIRVVADISKLAAQIAHTDFVPRAMQGKPAAIAAAMLAGREMGIGPMTALQNLSVIGGKPAQSALLMRALVLSKGHHIEYVETTDSRVVVRGRRINEPDWTEVEFTADQARKAKIDLGGYPVDKLVARATARLCRRKFADVISGMAHTIEELQDGDAALIEIGEAPAALPATEPSAPPRTVQRRQPARRTRTAATSRQTPAEPAPAPTPTGGPPLPGEDGYDDPTASPQGGNEEDPAAGQPERRDGKASSAQNRLMHALFREAQIEDRDERLHLTGVILNRRLDTSAGLTVDDARTVIDTLSELKASGDLPAAVTALLNAHEQRVMEAELAEQGAEQAAADDDTRSGT